MEGLSDRFAEGRSCRFGLRRPNHPVQLKLPSPYPQRVVSVVADCVGLATIVFLRVLR